MKPLEKVQELEERIRGKYQDKLQFRFGDLMYNRVNSYEMGIATIKKITTTAEKGWRRIETDLFDSGLNDQFCKESLREIKSSDSIVYARAGNQILAILDYRNPAQQKPIHIDERFVEGKLGLCLVQDSAIFHIHTKETRGNICLTSSIPVAIFRNATILYHDTKL